MGVAPLPVIPRPKEGEALSSWVRRLAARYDIALAPFMAAVLACRPPATDSEAAAVLDVGGLPEAEHALSELSGLPAEEIAALRPIARIADAGWIRADPVWCHLCLAEDLLHEGEIHFRAAWRTAACAACERHGLLLGNACDACGDPALIPGRTMAIDGGRVYGVCPTQGRCPGTEATHAIPKHGPRGDGHALALKAGDLRLVLALQAVLAAVLSGREPPPNPWADVVPPASLLPACAVILGVLAYGWPGRCRPNEKMPAASLVHLSGCASVLDVLAGGRGIQVALWPAAPFGPSPAPPDLRAVACAAQGDLHRWLVDQASAIGGAFAVGVADAVEHAHLSNGRRGDPYMGRLPPTPRQVRIAENERELAARLKTLLADPEVQGRLIGLRGAKRRWVLDSLIMRARRESDAA